MQQQLHNAGIQIGFNPLNLKEVDEAKKKYIEARNQGRRIVDLAGAPVTAFRPSLEGFLIQETELLENQFAIRFFDATGDRRLIWNAGNPGEIREAKEEFDKFVQKGWKPYAIDRNGKVGKRIRSFDAEAQEIVFEENGLREKLGGFSAKFKEIKMMPRTYPG